MSSIPSEFASERQGVVLTIGGIAKSSLPPPVIEEELLLKIVRKQDEERESGWNPTGDCADGDPGHDP